MFMILQRLTQSLTQSLIHTKPNTNILLVYNACKDHWEQTLNKTAIRHQSQSQSQRQR